MFVVIRAAGFSILMMGVVAVGGCSTTGLRGNTQSVAGLEAPRYDGPSYAGSQYGVGGDDRRGRPAQRGFAEPPVERGYGFEPPPTLEQPDDVRRAAPPRPSLVREPEGAPQVRYYGLSGQPENGSQRNDAAGAWQASPRGRPVEAPSAPRLSDQAARPSPERWHEQRPKHGPVHGPERRMALAKPEMPSADVLPAGQSAREASPQYVRRGLARWMGASWKNHKTTSGEMFDPGRLTAAHDSLPLPSFLYVTNRSNGRTVLVRVNDRVPANANRVVIVSQLAAELLGFGGSGQADVDLQFGGPAAVEPNAKHEEAFLKNQPWFHRDLLRDTLSAKAGKGDRPAGAAGRYPAPQYPRWDNTQR